MSGHSFVKCEAVKVSYRQTKDGMVIAFAIHPNELPPELALAPVGTRVLLAVAEVADEEPVPAKPSSDRSEKAREAYAMKDKMQQAATRSGMLPKDRAFRRYVADKVDPNFLVIASEERCAQFIREQCGISTRAQIASSEQAYELFLALETSFKQSQGQFAEARG